MIRDLVERFRYRFQLWRRAQRDDWVGPPHSEVTYEPDYVSEYSDPSRIVMLKESAIRFVGRSAQAYFGVIIIVSWICLLLGRFIPSARFGLGVAFLVFVVFWTFAMISGTLRLTKARKHVPSPDYKII